MQKLVKRDLSSKEGQLSTKEIELQNSWRLSAKLIEFGLQVAQANDDWGGIDLIAFNQTDTYRIQVKGRLDVERKYLGKGLLMAFPIRKKDRRWLLIPHDDLWDYVDGFAKDRKTGESYVRIHGSYSTQSIGVKHIPDLIEMSIVPPMVIEPEQEESVED